MNPRVQRSRWARAPLAGTRDLTIIVEHVSHEFVKTMPISKFKATCLAVMQRVKRTGRPVLITRFGQPVAEVIPPRPSVPTSSWIGSMAGRAIIVGDLVGPVGDAEEWEALQP